MPTRDTTISSFDGQSAVTRTLVGSGARALLADELLLNAPQWLCHPIHVRPLEEVLANRTNDSNLPSDRVRRLVALISYTFWWKYYAAIPASVRNLVWMTIFDECRSLWAGNVEMAERIRALGLLLINGNWPIAIDDKQELIVLVRK